MNHKIALIEKIILGSNQRDVNAARSYRSALRDAEKFWRLWHSFSDQLPQKEELKKQYFDAMNSRGKE